MEEHERKDVEAETADDEVDAHLLKETIAAGVASAAIFAGTAQAGPFAPEPGPTGAEPGQIVSGNLPDTSLPGAAIVQQQTQPVHKSTKAKKAKKSHKAKSSHKSSAAQSHVGRNLNVSDQ